MDVGRNTGKACASFVRIENKRLRNRYYKKSTRTSIQKLREMTDKLEAATFMPKVFSMIDKLAKRNLFHKNKAANLKSGLMKRIAHL